MRILLVLYRSELTVSEICRILAQSQPRVSRHLRLLCDAGLLTRQAEGTSAYYRHARTPFAEQFLASIRSLTDLDDATVEHDREQLSRVRSDREELAARSYEKIAFESALLTDRQVPVPLVESAMLDAVGPERIGRLLDIGTGTGRVLELFAHRIDHGVGIELSPEMLNLARTTLDRDDLSHCSVRHGNAYALEVGIGTVDLAVLHHVLHFLDEPARAVEEAARTIAADGRLLVVDYATHDVEALRVKHGHRRLGFTEDEVIGWCRQADLGAVSVRSLTPASGAGLTITIWVAVQRHDAPALHHLEAAT